MEENNINNVLVIKLYLIKHTNNNSVTRGHNLNVFKLDNLVKINLNEKQIYENILWSILLILNIFLYL